MAQFVVGDNRVFEQLMFNSPSAPILDVINQDVQRLNLLGNNFGSQIMTTAYNAFDSFNSSDALRLARAATRGVMNVWNVDTIRPLNTMGEFQWAGPNMQRWIMAEPTVREMYHDGAVEGYDGSYYDMQPNAIGENHYDYRRVMNGIVELDGDDWKYTTYLEDLEGDDRELDIDEQADILLCWENLRSHIEDKGDDPTSRWNSGL